MTETRPDPVSWQERQRLLREDAILDAAAELLAVRGYTGTNMDEIAARVGISKPTLYGHFPSKEAIAAAVRHRNLARVEARLDAVEAEIVAGARARPLLERLLRASLSSKLGLWAARIQMPAAFEDSAEIRTARDRNWRRIGAIVERCREEGDCRADVPTALIVRHLVQVFRDDYADLIGDGTLSPDALAGALISLVFDGLAPRPDDDPPPVATSGNGRGAARRAPRRAAALLLGLAGSLAGSLAGRQASAQAPVLPPPGAPATAAAAAGRPLGLADVVDAALRANPDARAAAADARAAAERFAATRGSWFPALSFTPTLTRAQTIAGGAGGTVGAPGTTQRFTYGPALTASYLLLDFGGRSGTVGAARETASGASSASAATVRQTLLRVEQAYFDFQGARAVSAAQDANVHTAEASRDAAVARFRAGLATMADTLQASTALAQARVAALGARTAVTGARATLATVMGARADVPFTIAAEPAPDATAARAATAALTVQVDTLVAHALAARPDLDAARADAAAARQEVRIARGALLPSVALSASGGRTVAPDVPALSGTTYAVNVGLSLPLFDGGARHADYEAAQAVAAAARARADGAAQAAVNEVVATADALRLAADQVETAEVLLGSAEASEAVARGRYTEGVGTVIDLLAAQNALANARAQAAQTRWGWATSLVQLSHAAGLLGARGELPAVAAPALPPVTLPVTSSAR